MEDSGRYFLTTKEITVIQKYKNRIKQIQEQTICNRIIHRDTNSLDFYKITPKQELPKFLQKMQFKTLHIKQKDITNSIKVFKKQNKSPVEIKLRRKLRGEGHLMLLSEIYQHLGEPAQTFNKNNLNTFNLLSEQRNQFDQWEKIHKENRSEGSQLRDTKRKNTEKSNIKGVAQVFDYQEEIEKGLELIERSHGSETNLLKRYMHIEGRSKLLKKQLENKKLQIEQNIKIHMRLLFKARTEYHRCFEQKNRLILEQKDHDEEPKEDIMRLTHLSFAGKPEKTQKTQKTARIQILQIQTTEERITSTKMTIEELQGTINKLQKEMAKIMQAENVYYKATLRMGSDVRESGLVWVIQKLQIKEADTVRFQFPPYLDLKSKLFLIQKSENQEEEESLLADKKRFVNEIGRGSSEGKGKCGPLVYTRNLNGDKIIEREFRPDSNIPKKYRKSLKKMEALTQEFLKNSTLLDIKSGSKGAEISGDLEGMTHKEIYNQVSDRIKRFDMTKIKKEKQGSKGVQMLEYQSLLQKIKKAHIKSEDLDLHHQRYLLAQYDDNPDLFFLQAAACFGYKRAYSMIIKHYSWKNYNDQHFGK